MDSGTRPRFFTPAEVAAHDTVDDLWVSCLGRVCDLSPLVTRYRGERRSAQTEPSPNRADADVDVDRFCGGAVRVFTCRCRCFSPGDVLLLPILERAGTDISSWFDPQTGHVSARGPISGQLRAPPRPLTVCPLRSAGAWTRSLTVCATTPPGGALCTCPRLAPPPTGTPTSASPGGATGATTWAACRPEPGGSASSTR